MAELTYLNFDLSIEGSGEQYRAKVLTSPAGEAEIEFSQPFSDLELEVFYLRVGRTRQGVRRLDSPEMEAAKQVGGQLFEAVFDEAIYTCFQASLNEAQSQDKGLRLRLRVKAPELNVLPWEYLYNPHLNRFLSLSVETPIIRYLDLPLRQRSLAVKPPLKMLAMISSPHGYSPLDVEREWSLLKDALSDLEQRGLLSLERLERANLLTLQRRLRRGDVHLFHFIGHGKFDPKTKDGLLLLEDEQGRGNPLSGSYLGTLLHNHRSLRLVVLNACEGARVSSDDPFSGAAQSLVQQGIPAVVAMQFEITDRAAATFAREFYGALADGYPVDAALVEARTAIFGQENDIEWGTPVYFTRAPNGRVFDLTGVPAEVKRDPEEPRVADPELKARLERLYWDGLSAFHLEDWETARSKFRAVVGLDPDYRDVPARLAEVEKKIELKALYAQAQAAVEEGNWREARKVLGKLVERDPVYKDAAKKLEEAEKQIQLADLYAQARNLAHRQHWGAVVSVFEKIRGIQEDYPDPADLLASALKELEAQKRQEELEALYRQAIEAMDKGEWEGAVGILESLLEMDADYPNTAALLERARTERDKSEPQETVVERPETAPSLRRNPWRIVLGIVGIVALIVVVIFGGQAISESKQHPNATKTAAALVIQPSETPHVTATSPPSPTPLPTQIVYKGVPMALVPAGEFQMGSEDPNFFGEKPVHMVNLDSFYIDVYEVTNARFAECVEARACDPPADTGSHSRESYYGNPSYRDYPVIHVDWNIADVYCQWRDARLPTEAEWEKAARGGLEGREYPWGDETPVCEYGAPNGAKFDDIAGCHFTDTEQVGSYSPNGYGLYDIAGNVWEWVADWYDVYPGGESIAPSVFGEKYRVMRGGSWNRGDTSSRVAYRGRGSPSESKEDVGFRCARSPDTLAGLSQTERPSPEISSTIIPTPEPTNTPVPPSPTQTRAPTNTYTPTSPPSPTDLPSQITDDFGVPMAFVSAGSFQMGSEEGEDDERPVHTVYLDAFYIDVYEVTNARYAECVEDGVCDPPRSTSFSYRRDRYYGDPSYDDYPIVFVDWDMARAYCHWRDARLPTEAEWEKAARGGLEGKLYPWGDEAPVCEYGAPNGAKFYDGGSHDLSVSELVGSYSPNGYGLYDMAGNVYEWVADWYDVYPGGDPGASDDFGERNRVLRGGAFYSAPYSLCAANREWYDPDSSLNSIGFRCARSP